MINVIGALDCEEIFHSKSRFLRKSDSSTGLRRVQSASVNWAKHRIGVTQHLVNVHGVLVSGSNILVADHNGGRLGRILQPVALSQLHIVYLCLVLII